MVPRPRLVLGALVLLALAAPAGVTAQTGGQRAYWPTAGWRAAPPEEHGVDPAALADVDARVPYETPDLSALLVVRHRSIGSPPGPTSGNSKVHAFAIGAPAVSRGLFVLASRGDERWTNPHPPPPPRGYSARAREGGAWLRTSVVPACMGACRKNPHREAV